MKVRDFVRQVERTFGEYTPGMRDAVAAFVESLAEAWLEKLYLKLLNEHEDHWPPALAKIRRLLRELSNHPPAASLLVDITMTDEERREAAARVRELLKDLERKKRMETAEPPSARMRGGRVPLEEKP